jgi:hypothetical protein
VSSIIEKKCCNEHLFVWPTDRHRQTRSFSKPTRRFP